MSALKSELSAYQLAMTVYKSQRYETKPELSSIYKLDIRIVADGKVNAKFTIDELFFPGTFRIVDELNPGQRKHAYMGIGGGSSKVTTIESIFADQILFISIINKLSESSLINKEFAAQICQELPNLVQIASLAESLRQPEKRVAQQLGAGIYSQIPGSTYDPDAPFCGIAPGPSF